MEDDWKIHGRYMDFPFFSEDTHGVGGPLLRLTVGAAAISKDLLAAFPELHLFGLRGTPGQRIRRPPVAGMNTPYSQREFCFLLVSLETPH